MTLEGVPDPNDPQEGVKVTKKAEFNQIKKWILKMISIDFSVNFSQLILGVATPNPPLFLGDQSPTTPARGRAAP
jgi:hypothetical protein